MVVEIVPRPLGGAVGVGDGVAEGVAVGDGDGDIFGTIWAVFEALPDGADLHPFKTINRQTTKGNLKVTIDFIVSKLHLTVNVSGMTDLRTH